MPPSLDHIEECLWYCHSTFAEHNIWHLVCYGTLLGAIRHRDLIPWDKDFDMLVRPNDLERVLALNATIARDGYEIKELILPGGSLAVNLDGVATFKPMMMQIYHHGTKIGDLYMYDLFSDGILRRYDFESEIYWHPPGAFPYYFVESTIEVSIRGRRYPSMRRPEKFLEGFYGDDWKTPYRCTVSGGEYRPDRTKYGARYDPKIARQIAWCESQGWNRGQYAYEAEWPRDVRGAGPIGPCNRTRDNSRALWWRSLDELLEFY